MTEIKLIFPDTPAFRAAAIDFLENASPSLFFPDEPTESDHSTRGHLLKAGAVLVGTRPTFTTVGEAIAQHAVEHPHRDVYVEPTGTLATDLAHAEASFTAPEPSLTDTLGVDSTGRRWDHRIDSSNQKKNADGTWYARRNVAPLKRSQVIAELMGTVATTPATPPPPPPNQIPPPPPPNQIPPPPSMFDAPAVTRAPWNVGTLIGAAVTAGKIDELTRAAGAHGVVDAQGIPNIGLLHARPDLFDVLAGELGL